MYGIIFILVIIIISCGYYLLVQYKNLTIFQDFEIWLLVFMMFIFSIMGLIYIVIYRI